MDKRQVDELYNDREVYEAMAEYMHEQQAERDAMTTEELDEMARDRCAFCGQPVTADDADAVAVGKPTPFHGGCFERAVA